AGPDGIPGNGDDGTLRETFDVDKNGDGKFSVADAFRQTDAGTGLTSSGFYIHGSATGVGADAVTAIPCGGFTVPSEGNAECRLDTDLHMDWHYHCPNSTPLSQCPNDESGAFFSVPHSACQRGCTYQSPADGPKALTAPNSMHMGAHFDSNSTAAGDSSHLRTLQAFVTSPINLA